MIAPAVIIGHLSIKNITKGKKIWWYPESFLLKHFITISVVSLVIMSATFWTETKVLNMYQEVMKVVSKSISVDAMIGQYFKGFMKYYLGIDLFSKMLLTIFNMQMAYSIGKRFGTNIRPEFNISELSISIWLAVLPIFSLTLASVINSLSFIFGGISVVTSFAPMLVGFSVISLFAKEKQKKYILTLTYVMLFIFPLPIIIICILLGIIDSFYPLRSQTKNI
jgi:hypothetical protein